MNNLLPILWSIVMAFGTFYAAWNYVEARRDISALDRPDGPLLIAALWSIESAFTMLLFFALQLIAGALTIAQQDGEYRSIVLICLIGGGMVATWRVYYDHHQSSRLREMLTPPDGAPRRRTTD